MQLSSSRALHAIANWIMNLGMLLQDKAFELDYLKFTDYYMPTLRFLTSPKHSLFLLTGWNLMCGIH
jgi:hypothetical protein